MNQIEDPLVWSIGSALGAALGLSLHVVMSWGEWRKIGPNSKLGFRDFVLSDVPAHLTGLIVTLIVYFSLPVMAQLDWIEQAIGFMPQVNFLSAAVTAFTSHGIAIKLRNIARRLNGDS